VYEAHYGFSEKPFNLTPDPKYLYLSARHTEAFAHLEFGHRERGGFVVITGEVGTGKTTLSRWLLEQTPPEVDVALVLNPRVTATELLSVVCDELKLAPLPGATAKGLVDALYAYLLDAHARGRRTLLIVDEAQDLEPEVLEQVRLLTNLETAKEKLLQVILIGQPELIRMLDQHGLRQLAQRITARYHLSPFPAGETAGYIRHRLAVAGQGQRLFTRAAVRLIHQRARGIPRLINVICDRALLGAYAHDRDTVDAATAARAAREVNGRPGPA
jgi:general secretion pathway protein A